MMKQLIAATAATTAALITLTAAPAHAADPKPATKTGTVAWYNDLRHWGYLTHPSPDQCHSLNPDLKKDGLIANLTRHKLALYTTEECKGEPAATVGPHDVIAGTETGAKSLLLIPVDGRPDLPAPSNPPASSAPKN
jgi:hypothetical protein